MVEDASRELHPTLMHPAQMHDLIVQKEELYPESGATDARRALAQSIGWAAGAAVVERRTVGRALDCRRSNVCWNKATTLAAAEVRSEQQLDPELDVGTFVVALATEYGRILQGPDVMRLEAVHQCDLVPEKEPLVPRLEAVTRYGARLVGEDKVPPLEFHVDHLMMLSEKGLI